VGCSILTTAIRVLRTPSPWFRLGLTALGRWLAALSLPLLDDEAYYWTWSRHLQWGYLDHPPAVAVLVATSTRLLGDAPWAVRVPSFLLAAATAWVVFHLTRELYGAQAARRSPGLFHSVPLFVAGGVIASPDAPLAFLWAVATWAAWRALQGQHGAWWGVGMAVGLGMQSKYSMAFLVPPLALWVLQDPELRRRPEPYGAAALAAALFLPNVVWNAHNGWQAFRFVVERGPWVQAGPAGNLLLSAGGVLLYLSPLLGVLLLVAPWRKTGPAERFLRALVVPTLVVSLVGALAGKFKPHYLAPAALLGVPCLAAWPEGRTARWMRLATAAGAAQSAVVVALAVAVLWNPALLADQRGWDRVAQEVLHHAPAVVVTTTYQQAGQLSYALRERVPVAVLPGPHTFDQWSPLRRYNGQPALFIHDTRDPPPGGYAAWCRDPQPVGKVAYPGPQQALRTFALVRCGAFSPRPP